jgi:Tfp pilus assembly protein PilF
LNPGDENSYYRLGLIYLQQKLPSKAKDVFADMLKKDPNSVDGHAGMAAVLSDQRQSREALQEYKRVAELSPSYQNINYNIGLTEARLEQYDDAIASLLKQRQDVDDADNENLLAEVYEAKGMKSEAADARQRAQAFKAPQ